MTLITDAGPKYLHIGSGTWYAEGWVNVDAPGVDFSPNRNPDYYADICDGLPFPAGTFEKIYMGHFLEHIPLQIIPAVLTELHRVAAPECQVAVVGPCMDLANAQNVPDWLKEAIIEHGDPPGGHAWTSTADKTQAILETNGLVAQRVQIGDIRQPEWCNPNHDALWQLAFFAYWPEEELA